MIITNSSCEWNISDGRYVILTQWGCADCQVGGMRCDCQLKGLYTLRDYRARCV